MPVAGTYSVPGPASGTGDRRSHACMKVEVVEAGPGPGAWYMQQTDVSWLLHVCSKGMLRVGRPGGCVSPMHTPTSVGLRATSQAWDLPMRGCACAHSSVRLCGRVGTPAAVFTDRGGGKPSEPPAVKSRVWIGTPEAPHPPFPVSCRGQPALAPARRLSLHSGNGADTVIRTPHMAPGR